MRFRFIFLFVLFAFESFNANAQIYDCDSIKIEIQYRQDFSVKDYEDLNIPIIYSCRPGSKSAMVYTRLQNYGRSNLGNCYFELSKYDSTFGYKDITGDMAQGSHHPPGDFRSQEEVLKYDVEKTELHSGQQKKLIFNLLNFSSGLTPGKYYLKIYVRTAYTFGYNKNGTVVATSVHFLESKGMGFSVSNNIYPPRKKINPAEE